jgi:hypothetical protein
VSRAFKTPQMVADRVAPPAKVDYETGKYTVYGQDDFYTVDNTYAHGAIPNEITSTESEDTFTTQLRVIRHPLLDRDKDPNRPNGRNRERRYTNKVTMATQIAREARVAAAYTNAANYIGANVLTKAGAAEWDAVGVVNTIQPITDIESRIQKIINGALTSRGSDHRGDPGADVRRLDPLQHRHPRLLQVHAARRDHGGAAQGVPRREGGADRDRPLRRHRAREHRQRHLHRHPDLEPLGRHVWVGVVDTSDLDMLSFARQFWYGQLTGEQEIQIRQYGMADPGQRGQWIEAAEQRDLKITANFAGALIVNTHT